MLSYWICIRKVHRKSPRQSRRLTMHLSDIYNILLLGYPTFIPLLFCWFNFLDKKAVKELSQKEFWIIILGGGGIALAVGVWNPVRMTDAILHGSPPLGNIIGRTNHFSPSSHFPTGQQKDKPANMTEHILFSSPPSSRTDQQRKRAHSLSSLPSSRKDQPTWESTFTLLHWLSLTYFEQSAKHMRRAHPIYEPLVSGKSFFHHPSF